MKQLLLLSIILTLTCLQSHAQNITGIHTLRIDDKIDKLVKILRNDKDVRNIRKNQKQVDISGKVVGNNRPDVQFDKNGVHTNVEYDTKQSSSIKHKKMIDKNDPDARNKYYIINK